MLMPDYDWQQYRDKGETPFARGLALKDGIQEYLEYIDKQAADKLREMSDLAVVVIDFGVAEVYPAVS
jgi:membrane carboxypeptidase/penicillin-binding protein PbpC